MNVSDVMTLHPTTIAPDATVAEAVRLFREVGCHHLPVISAEKHLIGILSARDCEQALGESLEKSTPIINAALARSIPVSMVMTAAPFNIEPDAPVEEAARLMLEHYIGCLPVMRDETLIGIITRSDVLLAFIALCRRSGRQDHP
jgi:acetoin utilization protein AcuB